MNMTTVVTVIFLSALWLMLVVILGGASCAAYEEGQLWSFLIGLWKDTPWRWRIGVPLLLTAIPVYVMLRIAMIMMG